ncbi:50S ribosomal protein L25 [bacterium]|nr:50S ribosomal protein L25 [bacterium]
MADIYTLNATPRRKTEKKSDTKNLRKAEIVPGVFYISGKEAVSLQFDLKELKAMLADRPPLVRVDWGKTEDEGHECMIRELQWHPVTQELMHIDFMGVTRGVKVHTTVPIDIVGTPEGAKSGGILQTILTEVDIICFPKDIPRFLEVDVSHLEIGDSIHLSDISREEIEWESSEDRTVVSVVPPTILKTDEDEEGEDEFGEEGAEESAEGDDSSEEGE